MTTVGLNYTNSDGSEGTWGPWWREVHVGGGIGARTLYAWNSAMSNAVNHTSTRTEVYLALWDAGCSWKKDQQIWESAHVAQQLFGLPGGWVVVYVGKVLPGEPRAVRAIPGGCCRKLLGGLPGWKRCFIMESGAKDQGSQVMSISSDKRRSSWLVGVESENHVNDCIDSSMHCSYRVKVMLSRW